MVSDGGDFESAIEARFDCCFGPEDAFNILIDAGEKRDLRLLNRATSDLIAALRIEQWLPEREQLQHPYNEVYEKPPQVFMLKTLEEVDERGLRGRVAIFYASTGQLFVNGLYEAIDRTVEEVEPEYVGQLDPEATRRIVIEAARHAMAFRVGKATVFALAKRADEHWTEDDMDKAFSKESLSIAADNYEESMNSIRRRVREDIKMEKVAA